MIIIAPRARQDIDDAYEYIARDSSEAADHWLERIDQAVQLLAAGELNGPTVRLPGSGQAQRWSIPPFRLYYRRTGDQLVVLRIYHQARRPIEQ